MSVYSHAKGTVQLVILVAILDWTSGINYSEPITGATISTLIKHGFSTNYFKSDDPLKKYNKQNIQDVYDAGFRNLRLRSRADLHPPTNETTFNAFLDKVETVVDDCLEIGVFPIISWIHHHAEIHPNETYRQEYIDWWVGVANRLKDKDYRLCFNLFTELGYTGCLPDYTRCPDSIRENLDVYTNWTVSVVQAIRNLDGNNPSRMIILTSPGKVANKLDQIDPSIYENDNYMMAEWHLYASGPNKNEGSAKYWSGDGSEADKQRVRDAIEPAVDFTSDTSIYTYEGAWMPIDNQNGALNESEAIAFGCYFAGQLKVNNISWSMNVLDDYYKTKTSTWLTALQEIPKNSGQMLNMSRILDEIKTCM